MALLLELEVGVAEFEPAVYCHHKMASIASAAKKRNCLTLKKKIEVLK